MASHENHNNRHNAHANQNSSYPSHSYATQYPSQQTGWRQNYQQSTYNVLPTLAQATGAGGYSNNGSGTTATELNVPTQATSQSTQQAYFQPQPPSYQPARSVDNRAHTQSRHSAANSGSGYAQPNYEIRSAFDSSVHNAQFRPSNSTPSSNFSYPTSDRQQHGSVEPSATFVDPSHVYDYRAEQQRKTQIEAERQRSLRAAEAARRAEEDRVQAEQRKVEQERIQLKRQEKEREQEQVARERERKELEQANLQRQRAEQQRMEHERAERERAQREQQGKMERQRLQDEMAEAARQQAEQGDRNAKKARQSKPPSKKASKALQTQLEEQDQSGSAATALQMLSSATVRGQEMPDSSPPPLNVEEAEMRAMFKKMREFNSRNPSMLAKLWEEERVAHAAQASSPDNTVQIRTHPLSNSVSTPIQPQDSQPQVSTPLQTQSHPSPTMIAGSQPTRKSTPKKQSQTRKRTEKASSTTDAQHQHQSNGQPTPGLSSIQTTLTNETAATHQVPQHRLVVPTSASGTPVDPPQERTPSRSPNLTSSAPAPRTSLWPSNKKGTFVEAAQRYLAAQGSSQATRQPLSKAAISKMLDSNPTYVQFCELLENQGIRFDRSAFARELLRAIPDALKSQPNIRTAPGQNAIGPVRDQKNDRSLSDQDKRPAQAPNSTDTSAHASTTDKQRAVSTTVHQPSITNGFPRPHMLATPATQAPDSPSQLPSQISVYDGRSSQSQTHVDLTHATTPNATPPPPPPPPPPPADKEEAARKRTFDDFVDLAAEDSDDDFPPLKPIIVGKTPTKGSGPTFVSGGNANFAAPMGFSYSIKPRSGQSLTGAPPYIPTQMTQPTPNAPLFNPRHPSQPTQNGRQPGAIVQQPVVKPSGPSQEQQQAERMRGKMLVEPIMRDRVSRKSNYNRTTIAQDVLLATGRHPHLRPLNGHLSSMQKLLTDHGGMIDGSGNRSDLSTIRWEIIDPGEAVHLERRTKQEGIVTVGERDIVASTEFGSAGTAEKPKKRRGRPTGPATRDSDMEGSSAAPATIMTTIANDANSQPSIGYAAFAPQYDENGKRKRGRPKGWKKSVHSREALGLSPCAKLSKSNSLAPGRPRDVIVKPLQEAHYQVYNCQWLSCSAELHNLDALRLHVKRLHMAPNASNQYECYWRTCRDFGTLHDSEGKVWPNPGNAAVFATSEAWDRHIDAEHIQSVAWQLGDGPRSGILAFSEDSDACLSDVQGRSVTPVIVPEKDRGATFEGVTQYPVARRPGRPQKDGLGRDEREASAELTKLQEAKKAQGFSLGPEGSQLANTKRRAGFLDDEDFYDIIESDGSLAM